MEIEPEVMPPPKSRREEYRQVEWTSSRAGPLATILLGGLALVLGGLALVLGGVMLFFVLWLVLVFAAVGLLVLGARSILALFSGTKSRSGRGEASVRFHIERSPPRR